MKVLKNQVLAQTRKSLRFDVIFNFTLLILLSSASCSSQWILSPRDKSIKEWESNERRKDEKKSDSIHGWSVNSRKEECSKKRKTAPLHLSKFQAFSDLLSFDYQQLAGFSENMKSYGITEECFDELFWEGIKESLKFCLSSKYIDQSSVNNLIELELWRNPDLEHPIIRPEISKIGISRAFKALNEFSGEWHGKWQAMKVHHLWLPVQEFKMEINDGFTLIGFQSCFTGDGFGWNYVVNTKNKVLILGFVYHFDNSGRISAKNPHYAFLNPGNQLTWVSDSHIYYEFMCNGIICDEKKHYTITGGRYQRQVKQYKLASGFQAVYIPEDKQLPAFKHLFVNNIKRTKNLLSKKLAIVLKNLIQ